MTGAEMISYFKLLYDVNGSFSVAGFEDAEIYGFINKAQEALVTDYCSARDWDKVRELFGYAEYNLTISTAYGSSCYVTEAVDPEYLYYITSRTLCTRTLYPTVAVGEWFENYQIPLEMIGKFQQNSANKGIFYNPRVVDVKQILDVKQVSTVTITGTVGACTIATAGVPVKTVTFSSSIPVSAANFVSTNYATYLSAGVIVSCNGNDLIFTAVTPGLAFAVPVVVNTGGNLNGTVVETVSIVNNVESNMFMVFVDKYTTPTDLFLHYVKKAPEIDDNNSSILRLELHRNIVERAVQLAMITVADPRVMVMQKERS